MSKKTLAHDGLPAPVKNLLRTLGEHLQLARKRRNMTQRELAEAMLVTPRTVHRLEHGDSAISLGIFLTAAYCLNLADSLNTLFSPETDAIGNFLEQKRQNERKRVRKSAKDDLDF